MGIQAMAHSACKERSLSPSSLCHLLSCVTCEVVNRTACDAALGLPNGTLCNVIEAPGVDPATLRPRVVEPALTLTTEALARMNEGLAVAESAINMMIWLTIGLQALFFVLNLASGLLNLRKHVRAKAAQAEARGAPPTLAANALDGKP